MTRIQISIPIPIPFRGSYPSQSQSSPTYRFERSKPFYGDLKQPGKARYPQVQPGKARYSQVQQSTVGNSGKYQRLQNTFFMAGIPSFKEGVPPVGAPHPPIILLSLVWRRETLNIGAHQRKLLLSRARFLYQMYNLLQLLPHFHFSFSCFYLYFFFFSFIFILLIIFFCLQFFIISFSILYHFLIIVIIFSCICLTCALWFAFDFLWHMLCQYL